MFAHEINFDWANLIFAAHYCVWGTRTQPLISVGCPVQLISEVFSRSLVSLGSQCPVSMNFCLIFLICNSGHWLIRVVIDIIPCCVNLFFLFNSLWIYLLLVSFFLSPSKKKNLLSPKKKMTEANGPVDKVLTQTSFLHHRTTSISLLLRSRDSRTEQESFYLSFDFHLQFTNRSVHVYICVPYGRIIRSHIKYNNSVK